MRAFFIFALAALLPSFSIAAEPTTRPSVLLLRFAKMNETAGSDWIGRVLQESLLTDAAKIKQMRVVVNQQDTTTDIARARELARDAHADIVVVGGYQTMGDDLKITGQIVRTKSGEIVGTLKSTATVRDCFSMEETLGRQLTRILHPDVPTEAMKTAIAEVDSLGLIRDPNYTRTFAPPPANPHQVYLDRYLYRTPSFYPYYGYGGCYPGFFGCSFLGAGITTSNIFYGD